MICDLISVICITLINILCGKLIDILMCLFGSSLCGVRVRVEHATGKVRPKPWNRGGPGGGSMRDGGGGGRGPPRRAFDPNDRCFTCNERGHYSYDCPRSGGTRYAGRRRYQSLF